VGYAPPPSVYIDTLRYPYTIEKSVLNLAVLDHDYPIDKDGATWVSDPTPIVVDRIEWQTSASAGSHKLAPKIILDGGHWLRVLSTSNTYELWNSRGYAATTSGWIKLLKYAVNGDCTLIVEFPRGLSVKPVSYTHLTLPTIYSV